MKLEPAFDVATKTWFLDDFPGIEAPTIKELLQKLPGTLGRYKVENYWPGGKPLLPQVRKIEQKLPELRIQDRRSAPSVTPKPSVITGLVPNPGHGGRRRDPAFVDAVLELWKAGVSGQNIADRFGVPLSVVSANIIPRARAKGDPRAVVRNPKSIGKTKNRRGQT